MGIAVSKFQGCEGKRLQIYHSEDIAVTQWRLAPFYYLLACLPKILAQHGNPMKKLFCVLKNKNKIKQKGNFKLNTMSQEKHGPSS